MEQQRQSVDGRRGLDQKLLKEDKRKLAVPAGAEVLVDLRLTKGRPDGRCPLAKAREPLHREGIGSVASCRLDRPGHIAGGSCIGRELVRILPPMRIRTMLSRDWLDALCKDLSMSQKWDSLLAGSDREMPRCLRNVANLNCLNMLMMSSSVGGILSDGSGITIRCLTGKPQNI